MDKLDGDLVSVIVPVFNVKNYVSRCIESILNQTYRNIEVIIVNDGSTDGSAEICSQFKERDNRVSVISQENRGLACARNSALRKMKGNYVMCVDSDDFIAPDMVKTMIYIAKNNNADYVSCGYKMVSDEDAEQYIMRTDAGIPAYQSVTKEKALSKLFVPQSRYCSAWGKLYGHQLWKNGLCYPENNRFGEDMYLAHILIDRAKNIIHTDQSYYYYNQSGSSLVRSEFNERKLNILEAGQKWIEFCNKKYPSLREKAEGFYYMSLINFFTSFLEGERTDLYDSYKDKLRKEIRRIFINRYVCKRDKVKACMIVYLSRGAYERIRRRMI